MKHNTIAYHPQTDGLLGMMMQQSSLIWSCDYSKPGQRLLTQKPMQEAIDAGQRPCQHDCICALIACMLKETLAL